jgi:GNAT superfamily N-acetyltransferase
MILTINEAETNDIPSILNLIKELAIYERAEGEVVVSEESLLADGFGKNKLFTCFVARLNNQVEGIALVYTKFSTWKGRCVFLEDIIVSESQRGKGIGSALFKRVIEYSKEVNAGRLEWQVLDWNEPAIAFYKKFNSEFDPTWINCRFTKDQLMNMNLNEI